MAIMPSTKLAKHRQMMRTTVVVSIGIPYFLAVAITTTATEQEAANDEAHQAQRYQKPEIDL